MKSLLTALIALLACTLISSPASAEILRFREVEPARIYRGSQPETASDYALLKEKGIRTIISLKTTENENLEEAEMAELLGIRAIAKPTGAFFAPSDRHVNEILSLMTDPTLQPVFLHCRHGKDRTGLIMGLYRVEYQGWKPQDAYREMRGLGFNPLLLGLTHYFWDRTEERSLAPTTPYFITR